KLQDVPAAAASGGKGKAKTKTEPLRVRLLGSGTILREVMAAADLLAQRLRRLGDSGLSRSGLDREIRAGFGWAFDAALSAQDAEAAFALAQATMENPAARAARAAARREAAHDPALAARLRERQEAAAELEALLDRQLRLAGRGASADMIAALESERQHAVHRLERARRALGENDLADRPLSLAKARRSLGEDEALLVVVVGETRTGLIAATRDQAVLTAADAPAGQVGALVERLRHALDPAATQAFDLAAAQGLHGLLFPREVRAITDGRKRLLVAAHGALSALPFSVLARPGSQPRWLIEDHALVTLPSLAALAQTRRSGEGRGVERFLAVGAPELAAAPAGGVAAFRSAAMARQVRDLPRLPATAGELRQLGAALAARDQAILTGASATEQALRAELGSGAQVIAFATHGLVAGEIDGLEEPALVVTPDGADDGLLTASEIMRLNLDADWVLLSACNTAAGSAVDGTGLSGLASAFLFAGGRNLLASHWAVRDDAAPPLSTGTVKAYAQGPDPAEALRQAMLAMMRGQSLAGGDDPRLWAPFVYIGR
ncbi:MAG TPA: CHAT domain-containing protein, partial [Novosphingobium sp.]|nr:CHAT domain-containing protein [Novosphingobium sp.]